MSDRIAVVTGSSSGIGKAIALELAGRGFHVIVHACRNEQGASDVASAIRKQGLESTVVMHDFAKVDSLSEFVHSCFSWKGSVDAWINNAGADVLTGDAAEWSFQKKLATVLQVDVMATLLLSRGAGQKMQEAWSQDGQVRTILNIGWDQAETGMAGDSGEMFAASKGAVMACSRSLAQSLAPAVRVNCIAPGWIQTEWGHQASAAWQQRAVSESLAGRWGTPDDVAALAGFLCSEKAAFISGQVIPLNGGFRFGNSGGQSF